MAILTLLEAKLAFGHVPLLDGAELRLDPGERIGLIGRNGTGKSSLLKILAGLEQLDSGSRQVQQNLRITYLAQEPQLDAEQTIFEVVSEGLRPLIQMREDYEALAADWSDQNADRLEALQSALDAQGGWTWEQRVQEVLDRLGLEGSRPVGPLSGGLKKRVALGQALVTQPQVLLLDEPTNHLDIQAIQWLEELLKSLGCAIIVVTHDRAFLNAVCTAIVELDRGILRRYPGNLNAYEKAKEEQLAAEALANARSDKLLAQEEVWIRKGVEARRTRSVSRIARLEALRSQRAARRDVVGQVRMALAKGEQSGKIVASLEQVNKAFDRPVVQGLTTTILRGDKVGIVGPNGAGKTTLLKLILGQLPADSGDIRQGTKLEIAYFDQMRDGLNPEASLEETISPGSEWVEIGNQRRHIRGYLEDFLFAPERAGSPVKSLSGGERNRLLLARLFARPANVLVLDEPTNDLDIETLELLEQLLQDYSGTVFLVSHDRHFLDNVVSSLLVYEGHARWREVEGGYEDWQREQARVAALQASGRSSGSSTGASAASAASAASGGASRNASASAQAQSQSQAQASSKAASKGLSFKEQKELDQLPSQIEALEAEQQTLADALASLDSSAHEKAGTLGRRLAEIQAEIDQAMSRWEALEARRAA